ncbi:MAG: ABC transporter ATP-binding protein [Capnocytophaga granulosa]
MNTPLLQITNLSKQYGKQCALSGVSLEIPHGSIFGLLGPNGAGKTTLIRILNQIIFPDGGEVRLDGEPLSPTHISHIGYMPEERGLYKNMTVSEQLLYLGQLKGLSRQRAEEQLDFWLNRLEIAHWKGKKLQELSKGMAQKVQFVATVLHRPKLLIFDEVFSGLDPINAEIIKDQVLYLREQGATILFSTHRMESVESLCDHIALLNRSKLLLSGELKTIKRQFQEDTYEVGIIPNEGVSFEEFKSRYQTTAAQFPTIHNEEKWLVHLTKEQDPHQVLFYLAERGKITHFNQQIPSVSDIFIQTIQSVKSE